MKHNYNGLWKENQTFDYHNEHSIENWYESTIDKFYDESD